MAIGNIKNTAIRRSIILFLAGPLLPLHLVIEAGAVLPGALRNYLGSLREAWRGPPPRHLAAPEVARDGE